MLIGARLGAPLVVGYRRGRDLSRLRRARARRADPAASPISTKATGWSITRDGVADLRPRQQAGRARDRRLRRIGARRSRRAITPISCRRRSSSSRSSSPRRCNPICARSSRRWRCPQMDFDLADVAARHHRRLRHQLLRRHGRQILVRAASPACRSRSMSPPSSATASRCCEPGGLALFISQSGETADTLAALRHCPRRGPDASPVVVNVPTSSMAREADLLLPTHAGPEIGVASTKAFTCQLAVLAALAAKVARDKGRMSEEEEREIVGHLTEAPAAMNAALGHDEEIAAMAHAHRPGARRPLSRPRPGLSAGAGRRAEAEGDQLHPRRGLCRRRDEARPDRADRRECAGHRPRAVGAAVREDRLATCRRSRRAAARSC